MDGVTLNFDFTFRAIEGNEEDIKCYTISTTGTLTLLTYSTEYTVALNANGAGGTVTVVDAESTGTKLLVFRETTNTQESDYDDYNQFPADTVEEDFDKRTLRSQEIDDEISRALKVNIASTASSLSLPAPTTGQLLVWNAAGTGFDNLLGTSGTITLSGITTITVDKGVITGWA